MIRLLVWPLLSSLSLLLAVVFLRWVEMRRLNHGARTFAVHFPRNLDPVTVTTFIAGLSAVRPSWLWRWLRFPTLTFEVHADSKGLGHYVTVPRPLTGVVMTHLRAALPSIRLEQLELPVQRGVTTAVELALSTTQRPLTVDDLPSVAAAVLHSLQPLRPGEAVILQWLLTPASLPKPVRLASGGNQKRPTAEWLGIDGYELLPHTEALRALQQKQAYPLFEAVGRVGVSAATPARARYLVSRMLGAYHLLNAPGVELHRRTAISKSWAAKRLSRRTVPLVAWPLLVNAAEVTGLLGWPVGVLYLPGLTLGGCRQLPPAADLPSEGCVVAQGTYPGSERPLAIAPADRLLHMHVCGPTGSGKSTLLLSLITQDMEAGRGVVVIDPKGDLVADCLRRVPPHRIRDVIVLDPADDERPVGFNLLDTEDVGAELVAEQVVFIFHQLFSAFWGPRTDDVLRAALLTLMREPGMTLTEVPLLLNNPLWRQRFVAQVSGDVVGLAPFWAWYDALSNAERGQVIAPLMNKLRATLLRSRVRHCIGQANPGLKLERALNANTLLFVPLRKGLLGDEAAALLGSLLVARVWQTIQARSALPEDRRLPVHLYIDEVQDYLRLPTSVGDMLAQARSLKLAVTVAHQHLGQLPTDLKQDLLANCRSKVIFQTTAKDAQAFEHELRPYLTAEDLQGLGRFEVVAQLAVGQRVAPPATGVTLPPPAETHRLQAALAWSRQHHGQAAADIEAAMRGRQTVTPEASAIGHKRRGAPS